MARVNYHEVKPPTAWSPTKGVIRNPPYDQFVYHGASAGGVVETQETEDGAKTLRLYCIWMNYIPPRKVFDDTRALMDTLYLHLRHHAPDLPPLETLKETLIRTKAMNQSPNSALERTASVRHAGCLRSPRAALRVSLTSFSLGL